MEWLDKDFGDFVTARRDLQAVTGAADAIFEQVWEDVKAVCVAARAKGMTLETNGSPRNRAVRMSFAASPGDDRVLTLSLSENLRGITGSFDGGTVALTVEVCPDGVVCLKHQGQRVTSTDAAALVMRPFLFGEGSPYCSRNI